MFSIKSTFYCTYTDTGCRLEDLPEAMDDRDDILGNPCQQRDVIKFLLFRLPHYIKVEQRHKAVFQFDLNIACALFVRLLIIISQRK